MALNASNRSEMSGASMDSNYINRSFVVRTFGPMEAGSIRGSIFTLCSVAIGAGVLSMPYVFAQNGFLMMTLFLIFSACCSVWSMRLIIRGAQLAKAHNYS